MEQQYQRAERRASVYGAASLAWNDAELGGQTSPVIVRNMSGQGIQVICGRPISTGAVTFLTGDNYECLGEVRYCVFDDDGYLIGIRFKRAPYPVLADESTPM